MSSMSRSIFIYTEPIDDAILGQQWSTIATAFEKFFW